MPFSITQVFEKLIENTVWSDETTIFYSQNLFSKWDAHLSEQSLSFEKGQVCLPQERCSRRRNSLSVHFSPFYLVTPTKTNGQVLKNQCQGIKSA
jgi:hypothetical protein